MHMNFATIFNSIYNNPDCRIKDAESEFEYMIAVCRRMANKGYGLHVFHDISLEGEELQQLVKLMQDEGFTVKTDEFICKFRVRWDGHEFPANQL